MQYRGKAKTDRVNRRLPKEISPRLFDHGAWTRRDESIALLAGIPTLVYFILLILTPLKTGSWLLPIGAAVFAAGACAHSILIFARTPEDGPVTPTLRRHPCS